LRKKRSDHHRGRGNKKTLNTFQISSGGGKGGGDVGICIEEEIESPAEAGGEGKEGYIASERVKDQMRKSRFNRKKKRKRTAHFCWYERGERDLFIVLLKERTG